MSEDDPRATAWRALVEKVLRERRELRVAAPRWRRRRPQRVSGRRHAAAKHRDQRRGRTAREDLHECRGERAARTAWATVARRQAED